MNEYLNEITPFIDNLINQTQSETIHWKRVNPTTLYWDKNVSSGRIRTTVQKVEGPRGDYFRFEVKEIEMGEELISIDTRESAEIQPLIGDLYNTAENYTFRNKTKRDEILRELLQS